MSKKILVAVGDGSEDIEVVVPIDILRRANYNVTIATTKAVVILGRGIVIQNDILINSLDGSLVYDAIILPGGSNGVINLSNEPNLLQIIARHYTNNKLIAAICAAPLILKQSGILNNSSNITSHPSVKDELSFCHYKEQNLVFDNNLLTARGAGISFDFAFAILEYFGDKESIKNISSSILYNI